MSAPMRPTRPSLVEFDRRKEARLDRHPPRGTAEHKSFMNDVVFRVELSPKYVIENYPDSEEANTLRKLLGMIEEEPKEPRHRVLPSSTVESPTKRVWAICDTMRGKTRKEMIDACVAEGINVHTARTQQSKWAVAHRGL